MIKTYTWSQLSQEKKAKIAKDKFIFIFGSVEMTPNRIKDLATKIVKKHKLIFGVLDHKYIEGFEKCPQFETLSKQELEKTISKLSEPEKKNISILKYKQKYSHYIINELKPTAVILINDSWQQAFHYTKNYYSLNKHKIPFKFMSPFVSEDEAIDYAKLKLKKMPKLPIDEQKKYDDKKLINLSDQAARRSFDHTFQTGAILAKNGHFLLAAHNRIVPFETYARHYGCQKEQNLAPSQDLNFFDNNHAEIELLIQAQEQKIDLKNTTLYINLLPCPTCARMISQTQISKIVYQYDHSNGYAHSLLKKAGKIVRRI